MTNSSSAVLPIAVGKSSSFLRGKLFHVWIVLALLLTLCAAHADPDDDYVNIFDIVSQADTLNDQGKTNLAHAKYIQAQNALVTFQRANPKWNVKTVTYRMNYLVEKIAATSEKVAAPASSNTVAAVSAAKSPVKLIDAGSEPRSELRYHPSVGDKRSVQLGLKIGVNMTATGQEATAMNSPIPMIELGTDTEVKSIASDGNITYTMRISDINVADDTNVMPMMVQALKSSFAGMTGMTVTSTMTDHGVTKSFNMKAPANAGADSKQMMDQMKESFSDLSFSLPNEPIGIGAKWELNKQVESQGLAINQIETYELVSKKGDVISVHATLVQTPGKQKNQNASMSGMQQVSGSGEGNITQDLSQILPTSGNVSEQTEINMDISTGQQKQSMKMKMTTEMTFKSK